MHTPRTGVVSLALLLTVHCGSPPTPADSSDATSTESAVGDSKPSGAGVVPTQAEDTEAHVTQAPPAEGDSDGAREPEAAEEPESKPSKPASEVVTEGDTDFLLNDSASELKQNLKAQCEETLEDASDRAALAECMQKGRDKFVADVLSFKRAESGAVRLTIYRRQASTLSEIYSAGVVLEDTTETSLKVSQKGGAKGYQPLFKGARSFDVQVPDDYSLIIEEPTWGKLSYTAKYGLVSR